MSAPRPYGTDPFHPLGSIPNMGQFRYIYNSVTDLSSMWYAKMFVYDNCACALKENLNYDPESFFPLRYMLVCIKTSFMQMFVLSFKERT